MALQIFAVMKQYITTTTAVLDVWRSIRRSIVTPFLRYKTSSYLGHRLGQ